MTGYRVAESFDLALDEYEGGYNCTCWSVCECHFSWLCPRCGKTVRAIGEEMYDYKATGGLCSACAEDMSHGKP